MKIMCIYNVDESKIDPSEVFDGLDYELNSVEQTGFDLISYSEIDDDALPAEDEFMIESYIEVLRLSTAHLTEEDNEILYSGSFVFAEIRNGGYMIAVPNSYENDFFSEAEKNGMSNNFIEIFKYALEKDYDYIIFDQDGNKVDRFKTYNW